MLYGYLFIVSIELVWILDFKYILLLLLLLLLLKSSKKDPYIALFFPRGRTPMLAPYLPAGVHISQPEYISTTIRPKSNFLDKCYVNVW